MWGEGNGREGERKTIMSLLVRAALVYLVQRFDFIGD